MIFQDHGAGGELRITPRPQDNGRRISAGSDARDTTDRFVVEPTDVRTGKSAVVGWREVVSFRRPRLRSFAVFRYPAHITLCRQADKEGRNHRKDGSARRFNGMIWG
ncbi:hypothetical protein KCP70_14965 [Salmonella enterica subsp. enterica]|nr:hypothetical protein KCP70_14965 [Salmonella enterica subsp. enterica]